jgi:uncharacterized protein (TIGR03067 family)
MRRLTSAMCWLILGTWLVPAFAQPAEEAQKKLQGSWTATKAERDGKAADDVVGHRLSFTGNRFQIQSKDGKPLYTGSVRVDPSAKPAAIDFKHMEGALKGKAWKGIYALDGDTLTICDNAPNLNKGRPAAFETKSGVRVCLHHVQALEALNGNCLGWPAGGQRQPQPARVVPNHPRHDVPLDCEICRPLEQRARSCNHIVAMQDAPEKRRRQSFPLMQA